MILILETFKYTHKNVQTYRHTKTQIYIEFIFYFKFLNMKTKITLKIIH